MKDRLRSLNALLKELKCPVQVRQKGNSLYLRATLPPKPDSLKEDWHQQEVAIRVHANPAGFKRAKNEALAMGSDIDLGKFDWAKYYKPKQKIETIAQWVEAFERDYFLRRNREPKSQTTWNLDYKTSFKKLLAVGGNRKLTEAAMVEAIATTKPDTKTRQRVCIIYSCLARFAGIDADFKRLRGKYSPKRVTARDLPSDEVIVEWREKIPDPAWQWVYGVIAAFGLRNHEALHIDLDSIRESELIIIKNSKTGRRSTIPCPVDWWQEWKLYEPILPRVKVEGRSNSAIGKAVSQYFWRMKLPFSVYSLRHAWAARAAIYGIDPAIASKLQGHSLAVHSNIYMNFLNDSHLKQVLQQIKS